MRRSLSFARWRLLSVCFRFSCWWQREWSCAGMSESLKRTTILHLRNARQRTVCVPKHERDSRLEMWIHAAHRLDEAESGGGVARRRGARRPAWFRRRADSSRVSERRAWSAKRRILLADRMAGATGNKVEGVRLAAGWRGSRSGGCARSRAAARGAGSGAGTHRRAES